MNKVINIVKSVLRWTPIVTLLLVGIMAVGTVCGQDFSWSSDKGSLVKAISSQFGHADWGHFWNNASLFLPFGILAEIVFKKKRWYIMALFTLMLPQVVTGYFGWYHDGMGASGWISGIIAVAGAAILSSGLRNVGDWDGEAQMGVLAGALISGTVAVMFMVEEIRMATSSRMRGDLTSYVMHIVGQVTGLGVLVATTVVWVATLIIDWRRNK